MPVCCGHHFVKGFMTIDFAEPGEGTDTVTFVSEGFQ
jgi:hypothetical protein